MKRKNRWRKQPVKKSQKAKLDEAFEMIRKSNETTIVPVRYGNMIKLEVKRVTEEERIQALMDIAGIIKTLKNEQQ